MKYATLICAIVIAAVISACGKTEQSNQKTSESTSEAVSLKIINWGPQSAPLGTIHLKQPDGSMGLWVQVVDAQGIGEAQVIFAGEPARSTVVADKVITAAIDPEKLAKPGNIEVAIKQVATGKVLPVGIFVVVDPKVEATLRVVNWGPQTASKNEIPFKQADGSMGIWIEVAALQGFGEAQVLFAGQPAKSTVTTDKLITAAIDPEKLAELGSKEVAVKQVATNKVFPVGTFSLTAK